MASNLYVNICKQMAIICWLWTGLALCWFLERLGQNKTTSSKTMLHA